MPDLYINPRLTIPDRELQITTSRSGGPGGQNVNKVNTKVTLKWAPEKCENLDAAWRRRLMSRYAGRINREGELVLQSDRYRDQPGNLADVRGRLAQMLLECQTAPKARKPTRPTRGSQLRRLDRKRQKSQKKQRRRHRPTRDD